MVSTSSFSCIIIMTISCQWTDWFNQIHSIIENLILIGLGLELSCLDLSWWWWVWWPSSGLWASQVSHDWVSSHSMLQTDFEPHWDWNSTSFILILWSVQSPMMSSVMYWSFDFDACNIAGQSFRLLSISLSKDKSSRSYFYRVRCLLSTLFFPARKLKSR